jgi:hypothetical protein
MAEGGRGKQRVLEMVEMKDVRKGGGAVVPCVKYFPDSMLYKRDQLPF